MIFLAACGALLGNASTTPAQETGAHPDFRGVWRMDTTKFEKRDALLSALKLTVSQRGDTLGIVTDVVDTGSAPIQMRASYLPATTPGISTASDPRATTGSFDWQGDTFVLRRTEHRPERTLEIEERWALAGNGKTLARFQRVRDGARLSQQTLLFTRQ